MSIDSVNGAAGIRNTISGNKTILETENKLASVMAQKENTDSKIELKESEQVNKLAETNEDEAKQVEQISNTLAPRLLHPQRQPGLQQQGAQGCLHRYQQA